jgi:methylenetetrahydrofolate dehydrogenase (NADP+)/methenyltetrahydrofolate cyclohydrolase
MTAEIIDGNALARQIRSDVANRTAALKARGIQPALSIILIGDDPASQVYTRHKVNDSAETGLRATLERYPAALPEADLLARIGVLNRDPAVHGILVQLPLRSRLKRTSTASTSPTPAR